MHKEISDLTTRNQLKGYGLSGYQARVITINLPVVRKDDQSNMYKIIDVISSIREYIKRKRVKTKTRDALQDLMKLLLARLGNVIEIPFERGNSPELTELAKQLYVAMTNTDKMLADMDATVASIEGKRK